MHKDVQQMPKEDHNILKTTSLPDDFLSTPEAQRIQSFKLPYYQELPSIGLYREQIIQYIEKVLSPLSGGIADVWLTPSMVNNYIKSGIINPPQKKSYSQKQIAQLVICCILKQILPIPSIKELLDIQQSSASTEIAYNSFVDQLSFALSKVFSEQHQLHTPIEPSTTREATLIRASAYGFANTVLLRTYLKYRG